MFDSSKIPSLCLVLGKFEGKFKAKKIERESGRKEELKKKKK